jgi:hypothetical protein
MANRVLRDWTDSEKVSQLSAEGERFFTRLIMKVDDFGCYTANIKMLKSTLFPLTCDELKDSQISEWLLECRGLMVIYEVGGKRFLQISDFKQRLRQAKSKYPLPTDGQLSVNGRPETKRNETEEETETETETADSFDLKNESPELVQKAADLTEAICEYFEVRPILTSNLYTKICDFVSCVSHRNELNLAAMSLNKYMAYKARSQETKHNVLSWIGKKEHFYQDGHWHTTDWEKKLNNLQKNEHQGAKGTNRTTVTQQVSGTDYTGSGREQTSRVDF